jgi:hypothetical protein
LFYTTRKKKPDWLYINDILGQLGVRRGLKEKYKAFVELGVDDEIERFYGKGNLMPYLGGDDFRSWASQQKATDKAEVSEREKYQFKADMDKIIRDIAKLLNISIEAIMHTERGKKNIPRWIAMYLCQEKGDHRLIDIAHKFELKRTGSIPSSIAIAKAK